MLIIPTIMCGGAGTRLWPASRDSLPKHLLPMLGGPSTFQRTLLRFKDEPGFGRPVVITSADSRFLIGEQLAAVGVAADIIWSRAGRIPPPPSPWGRGTWRRVTRMRSASSSRPTT